MMESYEDIIFEIAYRIFCQEGNVQENLLLQDYTIDVQRQRIFACLEESHIDL